jgi:putative transposase
VVVDADVDVHNTSEVLLPLENVRRKSQPNGGCGQRHTHDRRKRNAATAWRLGNLFHDDPKVARSSQPWADGHNPLGLNDARRRFALANRTPIHHPRSMPQSLSAVYIHLVFSTKERRPFLRDKSTRDALHAYLGGISKQIDCPTLLVGGVEDHVHLLARFGRSITQAEWVKELKRVSNLWLKERGRDYADFEWQGGYADFSVSQSKLPDVREYIGGQEEHHRKIGFQDELRALLRKHEVEWDEKYVWD